MAPLTFRICCDYNIGEDIEYIKQTVVKMFDYMKSKGEFGDIFLQLNYCFYDDHVDTKAVFAGPQAYARHLDIMKECEFREEIKKMR